MTKESEENDVSYNPLSVEKSQSHEKSLPSTSIYWRVQDLQIETFLFLYELDTLLIELTKKGI